MADINTLKSLANSKSKEAQAKEEYLNGYIKNVTEVEGKLLSDYFSFTGEKELSDSSEPIRSSANNQRSSLASCVSNGFALQVKLYRDQLKFEIERSKNRIKLYRGSVYAQKAASKATGSLAGQIIKPISLSDLQDLKSSADKLGSWGKGLSAKLASSQSDSALSKGKSLLSDIKNSAIAKAASGILGVRYDETSKVYLFSNKDLKQALTDAGDSQSESKWKSAFKKLGTEALKLVTDFAKDEVTKIGLAVTDQLAVTQKNLLGSTEAALNKAIGYALKESGIESVLNKYDSFKRRALHIVEDSLKSVSDWYAKKLGVSGSGNQVKIETFKAEVHKAIMTEVKREAIKTRSVSQGSVSTASKASGQLSAQNIIATYSETFFVPPLEDRTSALQDIQAEIDKLSVQSMNFYDQSNHDQEIQKALEQIEILSIQSSAIESRYIADYLSERIVESMNTTGSPMPDTAVMGIMDSTLSQTNYMSKAATAFAKTTLGQLTMSSLNKYSPATYLNKIMLQGIGGIGNNSTAQALMLVNEMVRLMNPSEHTSKVQTIAGQFERKFKVGMLTKDGMSRKISHSQEILEQTGELPSEPLSSSASIDTIIQDLAAERLAMLSKLAGSHELSPELKDAASKNIFLVLSDQRTNTDQVRKFKDIIQTASFVKSNTDLGAEDKFGIRPIWADLRSREAETNTARLYGIGALSSGFRVNKVIPAGEVDYFQNGPFHIFWVKPDLNLTMDAVSCMGYLNNPLLGDIMPELMITDGEYSDEIKEGWHGFNIPTASLNRANCNHKFSYLLSNFTRGIQIPDVQLESKDAWENQFGGKISFGLTTRKSGLGLDFSMNYYDTKDLLITNTIQAWVKYIEVMKEGVAECARRVSMSGLLDYVGAVYYFAMAPDNHVITHWGRYVGVYPTNVPWSNVKLESGGGYDIPEFSVSFKSLFHEWNSIETLLDFNWLMRSSLSKDDAAKNYASYASIDNASPRRITSDKDLYGGPTLTENRAYIRALNFNSSTGKPMRFVLEFESIDDNSTVKDPMDIERRIFTNENMLAETSKFMFPAPSRH